MFSFSRFSRLFLLLVLSVGFFDVVFSPMEAESEGIECKNFLVPGLPDGVSLDIMARVPRRYHGALKCVCIKWRDFVGSALWYSYRKRKGLEEAWLYVVGKDMFDELRCFVMDPTRADMGWRKVRGVPYNWTRRSGFGFVAAGKRFYLIGGRGHGWVGDATDEADCYDANEGCWMWRFVPRMPTPRYNFACQAVDGKIFALGGEGTASSHPKSVDSYDPETRHWTSHASPNSLGEVKDSVALNSKIYVRCSKSKITAYDISKGSWEDAGPEMSKGWEGMAEAVVVDKTLYVLNSTEGMLKWQEDAGNWVSAGKIRWVAPCKLAAVGKKIYIVGRGLHTTVFDTENGGNSQILCYPEWASSDINVIGCVSVAT